MSKRASQSHIQAASQSLVDHEETNGTEPPPYSSPAVPTIHDQPRSSRYPRSIPWLPNLDYSKYSIPDCTVSKDGAVIATYHPSLSSDPRALARFIQEQAALPPLPYIHIVGRSRETMMQPPDFDIKLNMLWYFVPTQSNGWNYLKLVSDNEPAFRGKNTPTTTPAVKGGLEDWARRFCSESSSQKTFTFERQLINWNTSYIEGQIRSLIAATSYTRHVTVSFPVRYAKIVVHPPRSGESFFTSLFSPLLEKKRYEVARAIWPYATLPPGPEDEVAGRSCAVQSEEAWWRDWKDVLRLAIVNKRHGWVSLDDMLEYKMCPIDPEMPKYPWGYC